LRTRRSWIAPQQPSPAWRPAARRFRPGQRAPGGRLKKPSRSRSAPVKAAAPVAEKFRLHQVFGDRAAVDRDEGIFAARRASWIARATSSLPWPDSRRSTPAPCSGPGGRSSRAGARSSPTRRSAVRGRLCRQHVPGRLLAAGRQPRTRNGPAGAADPGRPAWVRYRTPPLSRPRPRFPRFQNAVITAILGPPRPCTSRTRSRPEASGSRIPSSTANRALAISSRAPRHRFGAVGVQPIRTSVRVSRSRRSDSSSTTRTAGVRGQPVPARGDGLDPEPWTGFMWRAVYP